MQKLSFLGEKRYHSTETVYLSVSAEAETVGSCGHAAMVGICLRKPSIENKVPILLGLVLGDGALLGELILLLQEWFYCNEKNLGTLAVMPSPLSPLSLPLLLSLPPSPLFTAHSILALPSSTMDDTLRTLSLPLP